MIPAVGTMVEYALTEANAEAVNRRRRDAQASHVALEGSGYVVHVGNKAEAGQVCPMLVVRRWGDFTSSSVNGQVFLDGNDTLWATSVSEGVGPGHFQLI